MCSDALSNYENTKGYLSKIHLWCAVLELDSAQNDQNKFALFGNWKFETCDHKHEHTNNYTKNPK